MSDYSRLIEIFERLVAFPTVTGDQQASYGCLMYVERLLTISGMHINRYSSNGFTSLVATAHDTKKPKLLLQAHLDVVPGDESMFSLKRKGKKLMGRGSFDMKYAAACYLHLIEDLGDELRNYDLGIMFTTDEENDGRNGVKYLLEQGFGADVCILPDGGDNWRVETAAKGNWMVVASASGVTAHGSRPWDGVNAAEKLMDFLQAARALAVYESHTDTTLVVSMIKAGNAFNQIPDEASATLDIRFLSPEAYELIKQQLSKLAADHGVILETHHLIKSIRLDVGLPAVQEWERVVNEVRGQQKDGYALSFGASDARYFAEKGIPAIVTRPDGGGMHAESEWIDEAGLYEFYECIKEYAKSVAAVQPAQLAPKA